MLWWWAQQQQAVAEQLQRVQEIVQDVSGRRVAALGGALVLNMLRFFSTLFFRAFTRRPSILSTD